MATSSHFTSSCSISCPPVSSRSRHFRRGVSWYELLLLMAILAIFAAVFIPIFGKMKEHGRESTCASNMQHLGMAISQYAADNDGFYPEPWQGGLTTHINAGQIYFWPYAIYPYVKDRHFFKCPNDTRNEASSYLINSWGINVKPGDPKSDVRRTSAIFIPSRFVLLTEGMNLEGGDADPKTAISGHGLNTDYTLAGDTSRLASPDRNLPRHEGHLVFLYFDGHSGVSPELPAVTNGDYGDVKDAMPFSQYFDDRGEDWWQ